jgi:hypothetical protein
MNKVTSKIKFTLPKIGKKNIIILCAVLLICGAIYLNWMLFSTNDLTPANIDDPFLTDQASFVDSEIEEDNYFTVSQINRQRARDEAMEVLYTIIDSTDVLQELKDKAADDINQIAANIENEANIETLVTAKGFIDCVAVVNETNANIIIKTSGLMPNEIIQIKEIVYEQAGILPSNVKIIEKLS